LIAPNKKGNATRTQIGNRERTRTRGRAILPKITAETIEKDLLKMPRTLFAILLPLLMASCGNNTVHSDYIATENGYWSKDDTIKFSFSDMDTVSKNNIFINIRNDATYPYSNLFLITELNFPTGETIRDTLEYEMALPNGEWLGRGNGSLKENKLWYKENVVFPTKGVYTLEILHAMRKNGKVEGIVDLKGITDIGFQIEKSR
jgi:gliding motility-associated lipoprotein GldH